MTIWLLALILTAIACATLYYAGAGRTVNAGASTLDATQAHYRAQLGEIEAAAAAGRMGEAEAVAARGELAREVIRLKGEAIAQRPVTGSRILWVPVALVAVLALATYWYLGRPDLPAQPLAERGPVLAQAYMQAGRYQDAALLYRQMAVASPSADAETDLGEALMMANGGSAAGEPLALFRKAAALDPRHVRSRFYVAGEETRAGDYTAAIKDWGALIALAKGDEPWVVTAKNGLAFAQQGLNPQPAALSLEPGGAQVEAMVDGLEGRLKSQGGSIEEWTELVRSRMVQGRMDDAQAAYDLARKAYPDAKVRTELDVLAADNGLVAK